MEEKQLSVESVGIRETQEMLSGSDRDGEAEHAFLHFISGMRTSCREDRTEYLFLQHISLSYPLGVPSLCQENIFYVLITLIILFSIITKMTFG